jgi:acyl-CoA thioester hydrolase
MSSLDNISVNNTGLLSSKFPVHIYYEDTDLSGFVYHANYLKYFERAREHFFGAEKLKELRDKEGVHFVVASLEMKFHRPALHGDTLSINSTCEFSRSPVQKYEQCAYRGDELLVRAHIKIATLDHENRPIRLPDAVVAYMLTLQDRS